MSSVQEFAHLAATVPMQILRRRKLAESLRFHHNRVSRLGKGKGAARGRNGSTGLVGALSRQAVFCGNRPGRSFAHITYTVRYAGSVPRLGCVQM
jgi:hypothetical protein